MGLNILRRLRSYIFSVLVAGDVFLNAISGGDPDATISLRTAQAAQRGSRAGKVFCRVLDLFDPGHCTAQFSSEEGKEDS